MKCAFCGSAAADAGDASLGDMLGPMGHTSSGDPIYVHRQCALWSPEVGSSRRFFQLSHSTEVATLIYHCTTHYSIFQRRILCYLELKF